MSRRPIRTLIDNLRALKMSRRADGNARDARLARAAAAALAPERAAFMEALEDRRLLTTINGTGVMEYKAQEGGLVRVAYHNVTAELVFALVNDTNKIFFEDAAPPGGSDDDNPGKDLYAVYVAESSVDSYISIAHVPDLTAETREMQPFNEGVTIRFIPAQGGDETTTSAGPGSVLLGARTRDIQGTDISEQDRLFTTGRFRGLGIFGEPASGRLAPGLIIESGQDFGRFLLGGTFSGRADIGGSIDTIYAGAIVTGDPRFGGEGDNFGFEENFNVAGDIRNLITGGSIGTDDAGGLDKQNFLTGFDMHVGGKVGQIRTGGNFYGSVHASNGQNVGGLRTLQREIENRITVANPGSSTWFQGTLSDENLPSLGNDNGFSLFNNDSFDTPQILAPFDTRKLGPQAVQVLGSVQDVENAEDPVDYYAMPLLAGQTVTVRVITGGFSVVNVGVYDPNGRLIATDYSNKGGLNRTSQLENSDEIDTAAQPTLNQPFQFTADRPGLYRFAVGLSADPDFNGRTVGPFTNPRHGDSPYQLQITGGGNVAIGGVFANSHISDNGQSVGFEALNGDVGAILADGTALSDGGVEFVAARKGSLRTIDGADIAVGSDEQVGSIPFISVAGDVGLIRARSGVLDLSTLEPVGGDIQMIDGAGNVSLDVVANGGLGTLRAGSMTIKPASTITVNADRKGNDGIIDLIDVSGNFGTLEGGGPEITTGPGGNVRYIRVGGTVFRDRFFGSGQPEIQIFQPGEKAVFRDDSGSQVVLTPIPLNRVFSNGQSTFDNPGALTVIHYPIRGSGGGVLVNVDSTRGLQVDVTGGSAEIGRINVSGAGAGVIEQTQDIFGNDIETGKLVLDPNSTEDLSVVLRGAGNVDALEVTGGNFNRIVNYSNGEIVNVNAGSIGTLAARTLGKAISHTASAVIPLYIAQGLSNGTFGIVNGIAGEATAAIRYPFFDERVGVVASGDVVLAQASQGIGNLMIGGTVQTVVANADEKFTKGEWEGISGNIVSGREIRLVNIGEGLMPSGTGNLSRAGIYADGRIIQVVNQGLGSDIRGDIISRGNSIFILDRNGGLDQRRSHGIGSISLNNGAIIGSDIMVVSTWDQGREFIAGGVLPNANQGRSGDDALYEIGGISLIGSGGIMGSQIVGADIQSIAVDGGFGIINSEVITTAQGITQSVATDGFGIRRTDFSGGGSVGSINARGKGNRLNTTRYTPTVRFSEKYQFDPYSGVVLTALDDLHLFMGTTAATPFKKGISNAGQLVEMLATGGREVGSVTAQSIRASELAFTNRIGSITVRDKIDTLTLTAGQLDSVIVGKSVYRSLWTVAGLVNSVRIGGGWLGTNFLDATGPDGFVNLFATNKSLYGQINAQKGIGTLAVGTDIGSPSIETSGNINSLRVGGSLFDGTFVRSDRSIINLIVDGNIDEGATIVADAIVNQQIGGDVLGTLDLGGNG